MNVRLVIFSVLIVMISVSGMLQGQRTLQPKLIEFDNKGVIYKNERAFQFRILESGMAAGYYQGEIVSYYKTKFYSIDVGFLRDVRERRQTKNFSIATPTNSFAIGKINSVINIRGSIGRKVYLSEKGKKRGLAVGYIYEFGPSIALLKPYYLDLFYPVNEGGIEVDIRSERFSEDNAEVFLDRNRVFGASNYRRGFSEITIVPGIQAKAGVHFALGAFDEYLKALEVGIMADLYTKPLAILYETEEYSNKPLFVRLYANLLFGVRKNK